MNMYWDCGAVYANRGADSARMSQFMMKPSKGIICLSVAIHLAKIRRGLTGLYIMPVRSLNLLDN